MPIVKQIAVPAHVEIDRIIDNSIPDNWIVIPGRYGWHILQDDEYFFLKWETIHRIWRKAVEEYFYKSV